MLDRHVESLCALGEGFLHLAALQMSLAQATSKAVMKLSQKKRECDQHLTHVTFK